MDAARAMVVADCAREKAMISAQERRGRAVQATHDQADGGAGAEPRVAEEQATEDQRAGGDAVAEHHLRRQQRKRKKREPTLSV
jgi:hypothetical protein